VKDDVAWHEQGAPFEKMPRPWDRAVVDRSRLAGDWSGDCVPRDLDLRWHPVPREVTSVTARWSLRYGQSYRDAVPVVDAGLTATSPPRPPHADASAEEASSAAIDDADLRARVAQANAERDQSVHLRRQALLTKLGNSL
jgi:hypothetical protein